MTADLLALLDQLDEAYEASKLGGWPALEFRMTAPDAVPKLTANLRAVLAECDAMEDDRSVGIDGDYTDAAFRIRAALTPEQVQP